VLFAPKPAEATAMMLSLAAGEVGEEGLTRWIRDNRPAS
jgi:death-on-curing protein